MSMPPQLCGTTVVLGLLALVPGCERNESMAKLPKAAELNGPRQVRVAAVEVQVERDRIEATGTAAPQSMTKIMPLVPGLITKLPVKEGDVVKRGQVIATLDQRNYRLTLQQAQAAVEGADVALSATTREKKRFDKLMKQDATARAQYEQVLDKFRSAEVQMKAARVSLAQARKALEDTVIRAPYSGIVVKKLASIGDYATSMPPTVLVVLMQISTLELKVALPEPDLPRVEEGARVAVTFPSISRKIEATVTRLLRNVDPMTRSFEVVVEIPNEDMSLKPGLFAEVQIAASKPRRRLLIPAEALVDEGNGIHSLLVADGKIARRREVRVIAAGDRRSEVISGLESGDTIITNPSGILDGDAINRTAGPIADKPTGAAQPSRVSATTAAESAR